MMMETAAVGQAESGSRVLGTVSARSGGILLAFAQAAGRLTESRLLAGCCCFWTDHVLRHAKEPQSVGPR